MNGMRITNIVTKSDTRCEGAGTPDKCFYCNGKFGEPHDSDCVVIKRPVVTEITFTVVLPYPRNWSFEEIESHCNESSYCSDNLLDEIERVKNANNCLCGHVQVKCIRDATIEEAVADGLVVDADD